MTTMPSVEIVVAATAIALPLVLELTLKDGTIYHIPWKQCSSRLAQASDEQRRNLELSPGGYGIHWPLLDEDLAVSGLVLTSV